MNVLAFLAFLIAVILLILITITSLHVAFIILLWLVAVGGLLLSVGGVSIPNFRRN